jgi:hypothetical protein
MKIYILLFCHIVRLSAHTFAEDLVSFPWDNYTLAQHTSKTEFTRQTHFLLNMLAKHIAREPSAPINLTCRPAPLAPNCSNYPQIFKGPRARPAKIAHLVQFGFDVDTLEIHLNEVADVVDVFVIIESVDAHYREVHKPLMWDRVKQQDRFKNFNVLHFIMDDADLVNRLGDEKNIWRGEALQEQQRWTKFLEWNKVAKQLGPGDMIGFGDADEVPSRANVNLLKHCEPLKSVIDIGIWFPLGDITKAFRTDHPVPGHPFSLGDPTFWEFEAAQKHGAPSRNRGKSGSFLLGGMHMSDYCYVPYRMSKAISCSECSGLGAGVIAAARSGDLSRLSAIFQPLHYHSSLQNRVFPLKDVIAEIKDIVAVPWYYACNPSRYPSWELQHDHRI